MASFATQGLSRAEGSQCIAVQDKAEKSSEEAARVGSATVPILKSGHPVIFQPASLEPARLELYVSYNTESNKRPMAPSELGKQVKASHERKVIFKDCGPIENEDCKETFDSFFDGVLARRRELALQVQAYNRLYPNHSDAFAWIEDLESDIERIDAAVKKLETCSLGDWTIEELQDLQNLFINLSIGQELVLQRGRDPSEAVAWMCARLNSMKEQWNQRIALEAARERLEEAQEGRSAWKEVLDRKESRYRCRYDLAAQMHATRTKELAHLESRPNRNEETIQWIKNLEMIARDEAAWAKEQLDAVKELISLSREDSSDEGEDRFR